MEGQGPVDVCIVVLSGDIDGSSYTISYSTMDAQAEGTYMYLTSHFACYHAMFMPVKCAISIYIFQQLPVTMWPRVDHLQSQTHLNVSLYPSPLTQCQSQD